MWRRGSLVCSRDLDLDPMTLINERDLDIPMMYLRTENELSRSRFSNLRGLQTERHTHTDGCDRKHYQAASWVAIMVTDGSVATRDTFDPLLTRGTTLSTTILCRSKMGSASVC